MGWIRNMRVVYKILVLVIVAALGMIAIGFQGWSALNQSRDGLELVYKENLQQVDRIGEAKYMMRDMQSRAALAMAAHDQARFADLRNDVKGIEGKFTENMQGFRSTQLEPSTDFDVRCDAIDQVWKTFDASINHVIDLQAAGDEAGAAQYYSKNTSKETQTLREALEQEQNTARDAAETTYQEIEATAARAGMMMLVW